MFAHDNDIDNQKLRKLEVTGGFTTPPGYFTVLKKHILHQTTQPVEEYSGSVPDGYFEQSKSAILDRTTLKKKTISLNYSKIFTQYAAAAVILVISALSIKLYSSQKHGNLQSMSEQEIILYLENEDIHDIPISEVSYVLPNTSLNTEDQYITNTVDEQLIIDAL
jgi:hypothetical protein